MAERFVLIPYDDLVESIIIPFLKPYIGVVADLADHTVFVEGVLDAYLSNPADIGKTPLQLLSDYGVPTDPARELIRRLVESVGLTVQAAFVVIYPGRHYRHRIDHIGNVVVEEFLQ